ncbi:MAG: hypothetical protein ABJC04_12925 [Verrucomicrobiota bacterium]
MAISSTSEVAREGQAVPTDPDWPKGVVELVNDPLRTDGWNPWFSEWPNDVYHYGMRVRNAEDINHLITKLAAIKTTNAQVCLRPEKEVGSLGFITVIEKGNGLAATFSFGNQKRINQWFEHLPEIEPGVKKFGVHRLTKPPEALPPTLTLYVGHAAVDLKKIQIPEKIKVISEISDSDRKVQLDDPTIKAIDKFVAQRKSDENSAKGLQIHCSLLKTNFTVGEAVNVWCAVTNTTDSVKPIVWHPSSGSHYCLVRGETDWMGGVLPQVIPQLRETIKIKSTGWSPEYLLYLPPHSTVTLLLTYRPDVPEKFKGRVVYDPMTHGGKIFGAEGEEKLKEACAFSNTFEYEVAAGEKK